jgi:hypothetical protein
MDLVPSVTSILSVIRKPGLESWKEQLGEDWRTTTRVINTMGMSPSLLNRIRVTVTVTVTVNQWAVMLMWAARLGSRQAAVARRSIWSLKAWTPCCNRPQRILERPRR